MNNAKRIANHVSATKQHQCSFGKTAKSTCIEPEKKVEGMRLSDNLMGHWPSSKNVTQ